jgi:type II secretory pathway component GspD/PulD (secretin)
MREVKPIMKNLLVTAVTILASAWTVTAMDISRDVRAAANKIANTPSNGLVLNFHDVPLSAVLHYLSAKAGLIIVSDVDLKGKVSVVAEQPVATNEIVDLLSAQLARNNYAVALSGRTLTIMDAALAKTSALTPVILNQAGPKQVPLNDQIVTEILPLHSLLSPQLVKDLASLIPPGDTVTANEADNAIIMTASQKDVHRISAIVAALDSSAASEVEVFVLRYADAKSIASELKDVFQTGDSETGLGNARNNFGGPGGPGGGMPPGFPGGGGNEENTKTARTHAAFVADDQMNAVVASAPPDYMQTVRSLIVELDQPSQGITEIHVLRLRHADPGEIADELSNLFPSSNADSTQNSQSLGFQFDPGQQTSSGNSSQSTRKKRQSTILTVADRRTQSVIVTASKEMMEQIKRVVQDLDRGDQGVQRITALDFGGADAATVQATMAGLFSSANSSSASSAQTTTPLANRYTGNANSQSSATSTTASSGASGSGAPGAH